MAQDQVFISFRGIDTRYGFVSYLKEELKDNGIKVFTDEDGLSGEPLENLFKYIRKSRIALVIFSKRYADSEWCLDELVEIKKCIEVEKLVAIPIFYKVKAAHVKKQSGKFGERFLRLQNDLLGENAKKKRANSRIKRWKKSLVCVAKKMGLTYEKKSSEKDFVKTIVKKVKRTLDETSSKEGQDSPTIPSPEKGEMPAEPGNPIVFNVVNHLSKLFHLSKPLEALNLQRPNLEGRTRLAGLLSSMQNTNNISNHSDIQQLPLTLQSLDAHSRLDLLGKATNWLAHLMLMEQTYPALIFANWNDIVYYAQWKCQQMADELRRHDGGVHLRPVSHACLPLYGEPSGIMMLNLKLPQDCYEIGHNTSFQVYGSQINPLPSKITLTDENRVVAHPVETPGSNDNVRSGNDQKEQDGKTGFSVLCYWFKRCFCIHDEQEIHQTRYRRTHQL